MDSDGEMDSEMDSALLQDMADIARKLEETGGTDIFGTGDDDRGEIDNNQFANGNDDGDYDDILQDDLRAVANAANEIEKEKKRKREEEHQDSLQAAINKAALNAIENASEQIKRRKGITLTGETYANMLPRLRQEEAIKQAKKFLIKADMATKLYEILYIAWVNKENPNKALSTYQETIKEDHDAALEEVQKEALSEFLDYINGLIKENLEERSMEEKLKINLARTIEAQENAASWINQSKVNNEAKAGKLKYTKALKNLKNILPAKKKIDEFTQFMINQKVT